MKNSTLILNTCKSSGKMGSLNSPVYRSSTISFETVNDYVNARCGDSKYNLFTDGAKRNHGYSNVGTPTYHNLANLLCAIEGENCSALLYPNGLIALTTTALTFANSGDHILLQDNCYTMVKLFMLNQATRLGIDVELFDPTQDIDHLIRENTSLIMMESPGSYTFEITDIDKIVALAQKHKIVTAIDNSWGGPLFFKPLDHGIDVALYSATKYLNGHSDILMGASISRGEIFQKMNAFYFSLGITVSPDDCYLVQRGIKTLDIRVEKHQKIAMEVATWLSDHKNVSLVLCPALPEHPQHELWKKYFTGISSLFAFVLDKKYSTDALSRAIEKMSVFSVGASWGGCESIIMPCITDKIDVAPRHVMKMHDNSCIRIFCGLEDASDIINDLSIFLDELHSKKC